MRIRVSIQLESRHNEVFRKAEAPAVSTCVVHIIFSDCWDQTARVLEGVQHCWMLTMFCSGRRRVGAPLQLRKLSCTSSGWPAQTQTQTEVEAGTKED